MPHDKDSSWLIRTVFISLVSFTIFFISWMVVKNFLLRSILLSRILDSSSAEPTVMVVEITSTPRVVVITSTPTIPSTATPVEQHCRSWEEITLNDVGRDLCVFGLVRHTRTDELAYYIIFGNEYDSFFLIHYGNKMAEVVPGVCVQVDGRIQQLGSNPVIVVEEGQIQECKDES